MMGFTVYYRSTEALEPERVAEVEASAAQLCEGRTWLSCEPVWFFRSDDGHMMGGSKPNFFPHPADAAEAAKEGLPDGTLRDALNTLCELSRRHQVDWQFSHDYDEGPIGFIRNGVADEELLAQIEAIGNLGESMEEYGE